MEATLQPAAPSAPCQSGDPRVRRTREHLQQALAKLLEVQEFDRLSVQEITDAAAVNRATFYAHYPDKFALLECMIASRLHALLDSRGVIYHGGCTNALRGIVLGVCDFLAGSLAQSLDPDGIASIHGAGRPMQPHMETAIIAVVRSMILDGMMRHGSGEDAAGDKLRASTLSWAIYGAAREWAMTAGRAPSEEIAATVVGMLAPLLGEPTDPMREPPA